MSLMILRRSSRTDPYVLLGSTLALLLPVGAVLGMGSALAQSPPVPAPAAQEAPTPATAPTAAPADKIGTLKARDKELDATLARQRDSVQSQAKLRIQIEALGEDRRKFNADLLGTAARVRDVEANIAATRARLVPLDEREKIFRKSLDERHDVIVEILAALQRIGRQPPPALVVRPEDALQSVHTAIMLGAVLPEMRAQADALASDLSELVRVRQEIVTDSNRLTGDLDLLAHEQLRLTLLIDERQKKQAAAEQALGTERQRTTDLARQADSIKDLIGKLEAGLDPATRAARDAARAIASDATQPQLAALSDPG
ncbi:MAG: hypothetical protein WBD71_08620, partial [Xanthobacteraceae bacterium]